MEIDALEAQQVCRFGMGKVIQENPQHIPRY